MADEYEKSMDDLRDDVKELRTLFQSIAKDVRGAARGKARRGEGWLKDAVEEVRETSQHYCDEAHKTVTNHPWTSVLGAFGVGVVLGKLLLRR